MKNEIIKRLEGAIELSLSLRKKILYKKEPKYLLNIYNNNYIYQMEIPCNLITVYGGQWTSEPPLSYKVLSKIQIRSFYD